MKKKMKFGFEMPKTEQIINISKIVIIVVIVFYVLKFIIGLLDGGINPLGLLKDVYDFIQQLVGTCGTCNTTTTDKNGVKTTTTDTPCNWNRKWLGNIGCWFEFVGLGFIAILLFTLFKKGMQFAGKGKSDALKEFESRSGLSDDHIFKEIDIRNDKALKNTDFEKQRLKLQNDQAMRNSGLDPTKPDDVTTWEKKSPTEKALDKVKISDKQVRKSINLWSTMRTLIASLLPFNTNANNLVKNDLATRLNITPAEIKLVETNGNESRKEPDKPDPIK